MAHFQFVYLLNLEPLSLIINFVCNFLLKHSDTFVWQNRFRFGKIADASLVITSKYQSFGMYSLYLEFWP